MKQERLDSLADGIFAIVMTLLVFQINVPQIVGQVTEADLINSLIKIYPLFLSYLLSFSLLFTYWRSHHFIASVLAKNIDIRFSNLSALFFLFVGLIPFSALLLGRYSYTETAIVIFATNIILVGLSLLWMRNYVIKSTAIENTPFTRIENQHANMRLLLPVFAAIIAIVVSLYINKELAMLLFTLAIVFNLSRRSTKFTFWFINLFWINKVEEKAELIK